MRPFSTSGDRRQSVDVVSLQKMAKVGVDPGQPSLFYRYFTPESGVVGSDEFTAGGTADLSNIAGMFLSGDTLYYANRANGTLHTMAFDSGAPDATTDKTVNSSLDWRTHGMFVLP